jgi:hypothetical protein
MSTKTIVFYTNEQLKEMKEAIRTGQPIAQLARIYSEKWGKSEKGLLVKFYKLSKKTYNVAEWNGPKRTKKDQKPAVIKTETEMPEGFSFEGRPRKITFCIDHFKVYF